MSSPSNWSTSPLQKAVEAVNPFPTPENSSFPFSTVYKDLSTDKEEIRLVEIQSGKPHEPVSLNLVHRCYLTEDNHIPYEALSYCAGDVYDNQRVRLDGHDFNVFKSLFQALLQLRSTQGTSRFIWLDQICINQHDSHEKSEQVAMMKGIYEKASCVLSWLGPASTNPDSDLAFDFIQDFWNLFGDEIERFARAHSPTTTSYKRLMSQLLFSFNFGKGRNYDSENLFGTTFDKESIVDILSLCDNFNALKHISQLKEKIKALHELLRRPYWTRKWILQEVSVAEDGMVSCGHRSSQILKLFVVHDFLDFRLNVEIERGKTFEDDVDEHLEMIKDAIKPGKLYEFLNFWKYGQNPQRFHLIHALFLTRNMEATEPRDKLYSLLNVAGPHVMRNLSIKPDYERNSSISKVIKTLSAGYITSGPESLGYTLELANGILSRHDIPSWCFDFTLGSSELAGTGANESATILKTGFSNVSLITIGEMLLLHLRAIPLGIIEETSSLKYPDCPSKAEDWGHHAQQQLLEENLEPLLDWLIASIIGSIANDISLLVPLIQQLIQHLSKGL
ncbi:hypothetical protein H2200_009429 [Cladophialophora chaetospira]|uniref:Heterokaryon incompatibility domain-containing protein n=1 Tax=Cladophialophora chaetospira TaxID=386627 RepID=A0AA38X458_9EURO|nr:hypothetical protein H2200_009429 [Cladophialophora chaetospira]